LNFYFKRFSIITLTFVLLTSLTLTANSIFAEKPQNYYTYNTNNNHNYYLNTEKEKEEYKDKYYYHDQSTKNLLKLSDQDSKSPFKSYEDSMYQNEEYNNENNNNHDYNSQYQNNNNNYQNNKYNQRDHPYLENKDYNRIMTSDRTSPTSSSINSESNNGILDFLNEPSSYKNIENIDNHKDHSIVHFYDDDYYSYYHKYPDLKQQNEKYVILMFDRGYQSIFNTAKPIMDRYGFKASIFIACNYIDSENGMNWNQVRQLYLDGYGIQSHGLEHKRLKELTSYNQIESVILGGKYCLEEMGFNPTIFQAPYNKGGDDAEIVNMISEYFDMGFTDHAKLMFLNCDGWENFGYDKKSYEGTTDCRPYFYDGTPTPTNRYAMKEWSQDREHDGINKEYPKEDPHGGFISSKLFEKFVEIVESQKVFNQHGEINAIPIIGYHEISKEKSVYTSEELFEAEMNYLYKNGFKVITLDDLEYDDDKERFYIKHAEKYNKNNDNKDTFSS